MGEDARQALPRVAITGGIGAGKSYVCRLLEQRGIRIYDCDAAAKRLMRTSDDIRRGLIELVGPAVYQGHTLQKAVLAEYLLASEAHKQAVNNVVHPAVARDFEQSDYTWLESAILFDSQFNRRTRFDFVVCVTAPQRLRISRIAQRDHISRAKALQWIRRQMPQRDVVSLSDFEIKNNEITPLTPQIDRLLELVNLKNSRTHELKN